MDDFLAAKNPNLEQLQHDEMVRDFLGDLATQLELFGQYEGYNLDYQYYSDLAWGGLTDTHAFTSLPSADQTRIKNVILTEQQGTDTDGNSTTIKGRVSHCN